MGEKRGMGRWRGIRGEMRKGGGDEDQSWMVRVRKRSESGRNRFGSIPLLRFCSESALKIALKLRKNSCLKIKAVFPRWHLTSPLSLSSSFPPSLPHLI